MALEKGDAEEEKEEKVGCVRTGVGDVDLGAAELSASFDVELPAAGFASTSALLAGGAGDTERFAPVSVRFGCLSS